MRVMVFVKATTDSEAGRMPEPQTSAMFAAMGAFNEELIKAGVLKDADGLKPSSAGKRIAFDGDKRTVHEGPFTVDQVVAGFWIWEVKDMAEAVSWAKRCPNPMAGPSELELRPFADISDFEAVMTPELIEQEERLRVMSADANR